MNTIRIFFFANLLVALAGFKYFDLNLALISIGIILVAGIFGGNIGYHRYVSHGSFQTSLPNRYFLFFTMILAGFGPPIRWAYIHRLHHQHSDQELDPHCPEERGFLKSWFYIWKKTDVVNLWFARDLLRQKDLVWFNKHYYLLTAVYVCTLFLINPIYVIWFYSIPVLFCLNGVSALVVIPNYHGYRNFDTSDESHNSWIAHLISLGEGWHNNHHANPRSYIQGRTQWWEFDWCAFLIERMRR